MRLTISMKSVFVQNVLNDIPAVDYLDQIKELVRKESAKLLPKEIKEIWDNPKLQSYIKESYCHIPSLKGISLATPTPNFTIREDSELHKKLKKLVELSTEHYNKKDALRNKLWSSIKACTTLKQAKAMFPKLVKYLPSEDGATGINPRSLPVVNIMDDLTAAGWPKGKSNETN